MWILKTIGTALISMLVATSVFAQGIYQSPEKFLVEVFEGSPPKPQVIWITGSLRETVTKILQHKPDSLRTRYWKQKEKTVWILEEIGKEKPITVGIVIVTGRIQLLRVLVFRESRGWEVRHSFFTDQFKNAAAKPDTHLDQAIDGISGATLSVQALKKLARIALIFDQSIKDTNDPTSP